MAWLTHLFGCRAKDAIRIWAPEGIHSLRCKRCGKNWYWPAQGAGNDDADIERGVT